MSSGDLLTEHVLNLIPREEIQPPKPPKHQSKFRSMAKAEYNSDRYEHRTMGEADATLPVPKDFTKKHSMENRTATLNSPQPREIGVRKPPVPKNAKDEQPVLGLRTTKNFVKENSAEAKLAVPKQPARRYVDDRNGDAFALPPSGLEPHYIYKKGFGETPKYLEQRREEVARAQAEYDAYVEEMYKRGQMKQLTAEERADLIAGLKSNWEELHHQYQTLSVVIDTVPKKLRKERIESEMRALEKDIENIERHKIIYVANN